MKTRFLLMAVFVTMVTMPVFADVNFDFSAKCNSGQTLYYKITSDSTVMVTYPNHINFDYYYNYTKPTGALEVPNAVTNKDVEYAVTAIGYEAAFYGCSGLTSVTIPNSVTSIGSNAA